MNCVFKLAIRHRLLYCFHIHQLINSNRLPSMASRFALLLCLLVLLGCDAQPADQLWWNKTWHNRLEIIVEAGGHKLDDKPVELALDFGALSTHPDTSTLRLVEKNAEGKILDENVPFQYEAGGTLVFICSGQTPADSSRRYDLYFGTLESTSSRVAATVDTLVRIEDGVAYEGQLSFKITTPGATYYYHKAGAGFAAILDREGADWLGYRPCCESAGEYRGIPNMWRFHPGKDSSSSRIEIDGPLRCRIRSMAADSSLECVWDIFPTHARMTLLKADTTYWFLYEGIPGGSLEVERDYNVISTGLRRSIAEHWHGDLPGPEWVYFGDDSIRRTLYVVNHQDDDRTDQFWQMREEMVVFGFGREYRCCGTYMDRVPASFTVGFAEDSAFAVVSGIIANTSLPVRVYAGQPQRLSE